MPLWTPDKEWKGQDAFIVGGGSSLQKFDFKRLIGKNTIGCNAAFHLGPEVIRICIFGDCKWFQHEKWNLEKFSGRVVTVAPSLVSLNLCWLLKMNRMMEGLHTDNTLGWNNSTGATAINLAISLGAHRIYLLGYDMSQNLVGDTHWHSYYPVKTADVSFQRFLAGFHNVFKDLSRFPRVRVFNVTDGSSALPFFNRITFDQLSEVLGAPRSMEAA